MIGCGLGVPGDRAPCACPTHAPRRSRVRATPPPPSPHPKNMQTLQHREEAEETWVCSKCTYENDWFRKICDMCRHPRSRRKRVADADQKMSAQAPRTTLRRRKTAQPAGPTSAPLARFPNPSRRAKQASTADRWVCRKCTHRNDCSVTRCDRCHHSYPRRQRAAGMSTTRRLALELRDATEPSVSSDAPSPTFLSHVTVVLGPEAEPRGGGCGKRAAIPGRQAAIRDKVLRQVPPSSMQGPSEVAQDDDDERHEGDNCQENVTSTEEVDVSSSPRTVHGATVGREPRVLVPGSSLVSDCHAPTTTRRRRKPNAHPSVGVPTADIVVVTAAEVQVAWCVPQGNAGDASAWVALAPVDRLGQQSARSRFKIIKHNAICGTVRFTQADLNRMPDGTYGAALFLQDCPFVADSTFVVARGKASLPQSGLRQEPVDDDNNNDDEEVVAEAGLEAPSVRPEDGELSGPSALLEIMRAAIPDDHFLRVSKRIFALLKRAGQCSIVRRRAMCGGPVFEGAHPPALPASRDPVLKSTLLAEVTSSTDVPGEVNDATGTADTVGVVSLEAARVMVVLQLLQHSGHVVGFTSSAAAEAQTGRRLEGGLPPASSVFTLAASAPC